MNWTILPLGDWSRHTAQWAALNETNGALPFLSPTYLTPLLEVFASGNERLAIASEGGTVQAMGIVTPAGRGMWETFQPSQLPLGAWIAQAGLHIRSMLPSLVAALPGMALGVGLTQQDPRLTERPGNDAKLQTLDYIQTAWVEIEGSFDAYWNARGKNLRTNMRKQRTKLEADGVRLSLEEITRAEDVAGVIADYGRLESAGWKADLGTAVHPDNDQGRFYRTMLEAFCREGRGRLYRYRFDDKVVAVDLCIEGPDTLVILKTTYDESIKTLSPAFLMRQDAFERLFGEGRIKRIEFYGKMMEWHTRWTEHHRALFHLNYYRWSWLPSARRLAADILGRRRKQADQVASTPES